MTLKMVTPEEANLITWMLSQVQLLESRTGKKISTLELAYDGETGGTGIDLQYSGQSGGEEAE